MPGRVVRDGARRIREVRRPWPGFGERRDAAGMEVRKDEIGYNYESREALDETCHTEV